MKTKVLFLAIPLLFLSSTPALAIDPQATTTPNPTVTATPTGKYREIREEFKEKRQEMNAEFKEKREEIKNQIQVKKTEFRRTRAEAVFRQMKLQLVERFSNLDKIKANIQNRITAIETANQTAEKKRDLTAAKAKLAEFSRVKFDASLVNYDSVVTRVLASDKPLQMMPEVRQSAETVRQEIQTQRQLLKDVLKLIIQSKIK